MTAIVPKAGKVLLIDDDDLIAGSLRQYLTLQGCAVDVAVDHATAMKLMRVHRYTVIVVDPFLTGGVHQVSTALVDDVKRLQPRAAVLVVTGYGSTELSQLAGSARLSILAKPRSIVALTELILGALHAAPAPSSQGLNS